LEYFFTIINPQKKEKRQAHSLCNARPSRERGNKKATSLQNRHKKKAMSLQKKAMNLQKSKGG
jgi:hypothetical protein